jgi:hypothetical protein
MKYRKKPVVIEAVQLRAGEIPHELDGAIMDGKISFKEDGTCLIATLEGDMIGRPGDWIIQGVAGEFYPCKPSIFEATYEAVE